MSEALQILLPSLALFAAYWWMAGWTEWPRARTAFFAAGLLVIGLGVGLDEVSLPVHMAGHGAVVAVGAPLIVLSRPVTLLLRSLPKPAARDLAGALRSSWLRRLLWPPLAFAAFVGAQLAFHWTGLFWDSLHEEALHVAEHAIFLVTALWFWSVCLAVEPLPGRWDPWARAGLLMAAMSASDSGAIKLMLDGYGNAGVAMLASMLPLGLGAAAVAWTAMVHEERRAGKAVAHVPG
jgi:cytochrome c oxidase assembly factor CtaG